MKKAAAKKPHSSTVSKKLTIKEHREEYIDGMFSLREKPVSKGYLLKLALEWVEWARTDARALILKQFFHAKNVPSFTVDRWAERVEELKQAKEYVKEIIGVRRELGMLDRIYPETAILKSMPIYDKEWKELEEWRAGLAAKIQAAGVKQWEVIEVPVVEDCPSVPRRLNE